MKIFISYRRADSGYVVDRIRDRLKVAFGKEQIFRDIESIPIGSDFPEVLDNELKECTVMLVVIGPDWLDIQDAQGNQRLFLPNDFTRIEVETGLSREGILVIPVLVKRATMPEMDNLPQSLRRLPRLNGIEIRKDPDFDHDIQRLLDRINQFESNIPKHVSRKYFEPEIIDIPQGKFLMGSEMGSGIPPHETPQTEVFLPEYSIGKYPVTNAQFHVFIVQTKALVSPLLGWDGHAVPGGKEDHPVVGVTWYEAKAYCEWLKGETGKGYALPTEAQWEKACYGKGKSLYPWGDEFDDHRCNHGRANVARIDAYPAQSAYGCYDLVGNVRQWTRTLWGTKRIAPDPQFAYPWEDNNRNDLNANPKIRRVVRGSALKDKVSMHRCTARSGQVPSDRGLPGARYSFRVVIAPSLE